MSKSLKDGDKCEVIAGTHKGKTGVIKDINTSLSDNFGKTPNVYSVL